MHCPFFVRDVTLWNSFPLESGHVIAQVRQQTWLAGESQRRLGVSHDTSRCMYNQHELEVEHPPWMLSWIRLSVKRNHYRTVQLASLSSEWFQTRHPFKTCCHLCHPCHPQSLPAGLPNCPPDLPAKTTQNTMVPKSWILRYPELA